MDVLFYTNHKTLERNYARQVAATEGKALPIAQTAYAFYNVTAFRAKNENSGCHVCLASSTATG